ncbi:FKBP-type peptidyl-prolyl cis-trans isomerase [Opitutus sp. ER46]|uniref:FKBP-type peptidyl-prolyl cis-trans isomerase n=1 Tax=Opitutus sp. ER46 TaxID=2161864 RepID=UPI000D2F7537|nr:FKBP-type peptidyl-prolyl cis-trans isomerase [Opitutus sp. ER46]PTY01173.1 peptidylprolyl isomerase [Opitutus sp. ER46]
MRNVFYLLLLGALLATVAIVVRSGLLARKDPGRPITAAMREALQGNEGGFSAADEALIAKTYGNAQKLSSGLRYVIRSPGTGDTTPLRGQEIICQYSGRLLDGTEFDSSYRRGVPLTFRLGAGTVIKGWDEGFALLHKGERATLIIPYWLAYGAKGRPPTIPPKATLVFEVELLDWR